MTEMLFRSLAGYNQWANAHLYTAAMALPDEAYRRSIGLFFGSLHGTLNHLLTADLIWLNRLTGEGDCPERLDAIQHDALADLARARAAQDARLMTLVESYDATDLARVQPYKTTRGVPQAQPIWQILQHLFNHQTHHRGQGMAAGLF